MRESCSCGAAIHSLSYQRVKEWRRAHLHTPNNPAAELEAMIEEQDFTYYMAADEEDE